MGYLLICPIRKLFDNPDKIFSPLLKPGMKVLELGPGMGFYSLPVARMIAPGGKLYCLDIQEQMISTLKKRAAKARLSNIIEAKVVNEDSLEMKFMAGEIDFAIAEGVIHEVKNKKQVLAQIKATLKPDGIFYYSEPGGPVPEKDFLGLKEKITGVGFSEVKSFQRGRNRTAIFKCKQ